MLSKLRNRLILSHVLPLLIILPLTGIALIFVLENQLFLPNLSKTLTGEANLLAQITRQQINIWQDPFEAQSLLNELSPNLRARVMFLSSESRLLASTDPADAERRGQIISVPGFSDALTDRVVTNTNYYSPRLRAETIDVLVPVVGNANNLVGVVRMSYPYTSVSQEIIRLRYFIAGILILSLIIGALLGSYLALSIANPLHKVTHAIYDLVRGNQRDPLPEQGPDEIRLLLVAVNTLLKRLHELEEARRHLLANLVHELGRPLGALRSAIQALSKGANQDPELFKELLTGMDQEAERLQHLVDDLAHLHDQVLGTLELNRQPIQVSQWLPSVLKTWEVAAKEKLLHWKVDIEPDLPSIKADPVRLAQIIGNLTSNAVKFTPSGGSIHIKASEENGGISISVEDTGPGISREELEKVFSPYYRGSQGKRFPQGMGLGLSIAEDLVKAHGGRLELTSSRGIGSKFKIWLPKNNGAAPMQTSPENHPPGG
jgi:two-component system sensor histidine kinase BaeS